MIGQTTQTVVQPEYKVMWLDGEVNQNQTEGQQHVKKEKKPRKSVQWKEDTIDNEDMNKKKSKICCVYHKPHDQHSSSTCTSDDMTNGLERDKISKNIHKQKCTKKKHQKEKKHHNECEHQH